VRPNYNATPCAGWKKAGGAETMANSEKNNEKNNAQSNARNDEIASCRRHASCLLKLKYRRFTGREWDENT
jgi:hypothetical protein